MKKLILSFFALTLFSVIAQAAVGTVPAGYYRVFNGGILKARKDSAYVCIDYDQWKPDYSNVMKQNAEPIAIWTTEHRPNVANADPAAILYISNADVSKQCNIQAQGANVRELFDGSLDVTGSQSHYQLVATLKGQTASIYSTAEEREQVLTNEEHFYATTIKTTGYNYWYIKPVDSNSDGYYFGIKPTLKVGDKYYAPYYMAFPFKTKSPGMKVYYVSATTNSTYTLKEITDVVPGGTPVLVECSSDDPSNNRIELQTPGTGTAISGNLLKGVYFFDKFMGTGSAGAMSAFTPSTMRVWNVQNGKLVLSKATDNMKLYNKAYYIPANSCYLSVASSANDALTDVNDVPHTLTFDSNGGSAVASISAYAGTEVTAPADPTRDGYTFAGWVPTVPTVMPADDATYTAQWTPNNYTITFDTDGGSEVSPITAAYGSTVAAPENPTKTGYSFVGWSQTFPMTMPLNGATVKALWTVNNYTVTFNVDGKTYQTASLVYGSPITKPTDPTKEGYTFAGWNPEVASTMPAGDVAYDAVWTVNKYKVSFVVDGTTLQSADLDYGSAITKPADPAKVGYTFTGWTPEVAKTVPANNVTYTAQFSVNSYKVTFKSEGVVLQENTLAYGSPITTPTVPAREGYTFAGWSPEVASTVPAADVAYDAVWTVNKYKVSFVVDGTTVQSADLDYGSAITKPADPAKVGYTFTGWTPEVAKTVPANNVTYTAQFSVNSYKVTFISDGNVIQENTLTYGSPITAPANPAKTGYTFTGWDKEIAKAVPAENLVYTAQFSINNYTITFDTDGGSAISPVTSAYGTVVSEPTNPTKSGYTFGGWVDANGKDFDFPVSMPASDITVKAKWLTNAYTITFDTDGGSTIQDKSYNFGSPVTSPANPTKTGYTFAGWYPELPATMPANNVAVKAKWTINSYNVTFLVDDKTYQSTSVKYGSAITKPADPTKTGYTFAGWTPKVASVMPDSDLVYTAKFTVNQYKVNFVVDGSTVQSADLDYGSAITKPADPTKTGYTFTGWTPEVANTVPANDVTYEAQFSINSYKVTFISDGKTIQESTLTYGSAITAPADPTKTGYTFAGWDNAVAATVPANDLTYNAVWTINRYTVTYIADGNVVQAEELDYGATLTKPADPTKVGYTFIGWDNAIAETMPANDLTYTAQFKINTYKISFNCDNGTEALVVKLDYNSAVTVPVPPTKIGYTFKGWDKELPATMPANNLEFTAQWERTVEDVTVALAKGWNWVSFNVSSTDLSSVSSALSSGTWTTGDEIKNMTTFDAYSTKYGKWVGSMTDAISTADMYKIYSSKEQNITVKNGTVLIPSDNAITVGANWNYIGYIPMDAISVSDALANYNAQENDVIKSQTAFATYTKANGWQGELKVLEAGKGYMLKRASNAETVSFVYPTLNTPASTEAAAKVAVASSKAITTLYASNMSIVGEITDMDVAEGDSIIALANGEVRGAASVDSEGKTFLTVQGEGTEKITLALQRDGEIVSEAKTTITFGEDDVLGTVSNPTAISFVNDDNDGTTIAGTVTGIYSVDGKKFNTTDMNSLPAGTYIIQSEDNGNTNVSKIIKK